VDEEAGGKEIDSINVSSDWVNRIEYIPHIIVSKCLSVKYLTSRWISGVPEYEPICPTYIGATKRDYSGWNEDRLRLKRGSGSSGGWQGGPRYRYDQVSIAHCSQNNQQRIWTRVSSWGSQAAECPSYSAITRWPCSRPHVSISRRAWNKVSGTPGLGHLVHREEMGLGCWYARSTGGVWNGSWKDFHLSCSGNALHTGDWESCNRVATVHFNWGIPLESGWFWRTTTVPA